MVVEFPIGIGTPGWKGIPLLLARFSQLRYVGLIVDPDDEEVEQAKWIFRETLPVLSTENKLRFLNPKDSKMWVETRDLNWLLAVP
ncbi:hypothetical protein K474DRAFT_1708070 [Panus rudis PR-1116 ss-1]|nr:hypothetical protein K474DRAFT_1708070 [Panus rudis PR-1116 ss-1]